MPSHEPIRNTLGQPIGEPLPNWSPRPRPPRTPMQGRLCRVEPLDVARHAAGLFRAITKDASAATWTYNSSPPQTTLADYTAYLQRVFTSDDPFCHAIVGKDSGDPLGIATYMRIDPGNGVIEVGHIHYAPALQRSAIATEAMYLMMRRVFDELGYRRYEWKCDSLNEPSRRAALRLGFTFEGIFRQAVVYKGRNRDTAWYSILDGEWPAIKAGFEAWLAPANFRSDGSQKRTLAECRASP